jgi:hypothetical protein
MSAHTDNRQSALVVVADTASPSLPVDLVEPALREFAERVLIVAARNGASEPTFENWTVLTEHEVSPELAVFGGLDAPTIETGGRGAAWQRRQLLALSIARRLSSPTYAVVDGSDPHWRGAVTMGPASPYPAILTDSATTREATAAAAKLLGVRTEPDARARRPARFVTEGALDLLARLDAQIRPNRFRAELLLASTGGWSADALYLTHLLATGRLEQFHGPAIAARGRGTP